MENENKNKCSGGGGISVIVPVYNGEKYIKRCLDMLLNQEGENYEIIVVDDGSKDKTGEIVKSFNDDRIVYFYRENRGVSAARNKGMELSRGEWIVFCDVDDEISPGYIKSINEEISKVPDCDIFFYARWYVQDSYSVTEESKEKILKGIFVENAFNDSKDYLLGMAWSKVFRKKFISDNHLKFNEKISWCEDVLFMSKAVACSSKTRLVHKGFYRYMQNSDSVVHSSGKISEKDGYIELVKEIKLTIESADVSDKEELLQAANKFLITVGRYICGRLCSATRGMPGKERVKIVKEVAERMHESFRSLNKGNKKQRKGWQVFFIYHFTRAFILLHDIKKRK